MQEPQESQGHWGHGEISFKESERNAEIHSICIFKSIITGSLKLSEKCTVTRGPLRNFPCGTVEEREIEGDR
jgi:hypothetical protein